MRLFATFVAALALVGCDRGPADLTGPEPPAAPSVQTGLYIKGSASPTLLLPTEYRAKSLPGAAGYAWAATGEGFATIDTRGNSRIVSLTGQGAGTVTLTVYAYDDDGDVFAQASRQIVVQ
jgi:hypothetical protein